MGLLIQVNAGAMISLDQTHDACVPEQAANRIGTLCGFLFQIAMMILIIGSNRRGGGFALVLLLR